VWFQVDVDAASPEARVNDLPPTVGVVPAVLDPFNMVTAPAEDLVEDTATTSSRLDPPGMVNVAAEVLAG
jgi:hypothetical protein